MNYKNVRTNHNAGSILGLTLLCRCQCYDTGQNHRPLFLQKDPAGLKQTVQDTNFNQLIKNQFKLIHNIFFFLL